MARGGLISRLAWVHLVVAVLALAGLPGSAAAQAGQDLQGRFDRALAVFNSARQPEAIPQFSQLIDDLRALRSRSNDQTTLLARALQYRAQARENVGQMADADADLRLIREVAPGFRLTDPGLSPALVGRFNAMTPQNAASQRDTARMTGNAPERKPVFVSGGYEYVHFTDCSDCNLSKGGDFDVAGDILPYLAWAGEVSGASNGDFTLMFFGGGARFHPAMQTQAIPFGQVLFGAVRLSEDGFSESKGALNLSGGIDYLITATWGVRGGLAYMKAFESGGGFGAIRVAVGVTAIIR